MFDQSGVDSAKKNVDFKSMTDYKKKIMPGNFKP